MQYTFTNTTHNCDNIDELYPFLSRFTLKNNIVYKGVVDNVYSKSVCMYLIDPEVLHESANIILTEASVWFNNGCIEPVSIAFERAGLKQYAAPLCKTFNISAIVHVDGTIHSFYEKPSLIKKQQIRVEKF